jgi:hypothetical protein
MTQSSLGSSNPFAVPAQAASTDGKREPSRRRQMSLPLRMDDGQVRSFDLPGALDHPAQFSPGEFERLTRAYAEALGLLHTTRDLSPKAEER